MPFRSGRTGHEAPAPRRHRALTRLALLLATAWLATVAVMLVLSVRDLASGMRALDSVGRHVEPSDLSRGLLADRLRSTHERLEAASDRMRSPLLAPARLLPFAGRQLGSAGALAMSAAEITEAGALAAAEAQGVLGQPDQSVGSRVTSIRLLGDIAARLDRELADVTLGPRRGLLVPLARARNDMVDKVLRARRGLQQAMAVTAAVDSFLSGPRRYLLFAANNAEMRAGSGMLLSVGELETGNGAMRLEALQSVNDVPVPPAPFAVDQDLSDRWGWLRPGEDWRNLMLSPRFEPSARLAAQMWEASGHGPVDGVLVIDPVALQGILEATGPIVVDGRSVDADNIVDELTHDQYARFPAFEELFQRRDTLGNIARAAFDAIDGGRVSLSRLADGLAGPLRGRHVLAWSAMPAEQAGWAAAGIDGAVTADSLLVSVLNRGGNKLDAFLKISADLTLQGDEGATRGTLTLDLENTVPEGEPTDVAGPHLGSGVGEGVYLGILTVDLPGAATGAAFDGVDQLAVAGPDGPARVVGFRLQVARGERRTVVLRFRLPGPHGMLRVEGSARIPGIRWASGPLRWSDGSARTLRW